MKRTALGAVLGLSFLAAAAHAQAPTYRRAPGDTLRYREVTSGTVEARPGGGAAMSVKTSHDARIAVTFGAADTARAWFEALTMGVDGPQGERRPDAQALLGRPYTLVIGPRGEVRTVDVPPIPAEIAQVSELAAQFTDFFPRLPAGPLTAGTTWADTTRHQTTGATGRTVIARRIGSYHVRGDSTIAGQRVAIVEMRTETELLAGASTPAAPGSASTQSALRGEETGAFYFAPETGRLVGRRRSGKLGGAITISGGGRQVAIPQTYTYESRIELLP
ncbi:MAG TPA: hypothetical protein VFS20_00010 [Longimicrobium sp.]|nr:hypothetical protein [Longimicrobium sp.]